MTVIDKLVIGKLSDQKLSDQKLSDQWASTMYGNKLNPNCVLAHGDETVDGRNLLITQLNLREIRENNERLMLAPQAAFAFGAGNRDKSENSDKYRTCFQKDKDRILHSSLFRRLAGKTQVFIFPQDHQRTRLTHALEVTQVATAISRALNLNSDLTEAIALGHDCGHGPGGHASEKALSVFLDEGFDHASFGADVALKNLNLCQETLDGIRNHSWSKPSPYTYEGQIVSWADRIAYICHDFEDAKTAGIVNDFDLPKEVQEVAGKTRYSQLNTFITEVINSTKEFGVVSMRVEVASALGTFRKFNYEKIYMRKESVEQSDRIIKLLRSLTEYFIDHPEVLKELKGNSIDEQIQMNSAHNIFSSHQSSTTQAVEFVAKMTDKYAVDLAVDRLGYDVNKLPMPIVT
jgi:dGTPase